MLLPRRDETRDEETQADWQRDRWSEDDARYTAIIIMLSSSHALLFLLSMNSPSGSLGLSTADGDQGLPFLAHKRTPTHTRI